MRGCGPPRRGASQASGPLPGPHFPLPGRGEVWGAGYRSHREPGPGGKEEAAGVSSSAGGRGGGYGSQVSPWALGFGVLKDNWTLTRWGVGGISCPGCQRSAALELWILCGWGQVRK